MKRLIALLLLIFVFLAGCTSSGGGPGVTIKSVAIIPTGDVEPGIPLTLKAVIQNSGVGTARNVRAEIVGLTEEWSITSGQFGRTINIGDMTPSDPSRGTPGSEIPLDWTLIAPGKANDMSYNGYVRLTYNYETTLDAQIQVVTSEEFKQTGHQGGVVDQSVTSGPVSLSVVAPSAIISGGIGKVPITISILNNGPGKVRGDRLSFTIIGATCLRTDTTLIDGKSASLTCSINTGGVSNLKNIPVTVKTSYDYLSETPFSVTVLKIPQI